MCVNFFMYVCDQTCTLSLLYYYKFLWNLLYMTYIFIANFIQHEIIKKKAIMKTSLFIYIYGYWKNTPTFYKTYFS